MLLEENTLMQASNETPVDPKNPDPEGWSSNRRDPSIWDEEI